MHAERLNSIAVKTVDAFQDAKIVALLDTLKGDVTNRLAQPADASFDEAISRDTKTLLSALDVLEVGRFTPTWRKLMLELNLGVLIPDTIRAEIEHAFQARRVDSDLATSLQDLRTRINQKLASLAKLRDAFADVGIAQDVLEPEQVEFDVAMPRESISDDLEGFNKELTQLNRQLRVLASITVDVPEPFRINSISTNDFTVAVNINLDLADIIGFVLLALAVARSGYRAKFDLLNNPALKDLPSAILEQMKLWANGYVREEIDKIVRRLPDECPRSVDRAKLETTIGPVKAALEYIEMKQEVGFNMDVRAGTPAPEPDNSDSSVDEVQRAAIAERRARILAIADRSAQLKVLESQTQPILSLTEEKPDEPGGTSAD